MPQSKPTVTRHPISASYMIVCKDVKGDEPIGHVEFVGDSVICDAFRDACLSLLFEYTHKGRPLAVLDLHRQTINPSDERETCKERVIKSVRRSFTDCNIDS